ncbi:MAG: cyclodeaminase/cyclohydrolase family protein, partial [Treponema sp.]|nr:cyclodeaminase/cyclohydrolase family protein [Treponema sp.]
AIAVLELAREMLGKSNSNASSDLGVAALTAKAAVQGAWLNILTNISGIKDEAFAGKYRAEGQAILDKALPLADSIFSSVMGSM